MAADAPPPLLNDRLLRAARGEPVDQVPVWIMRQAGRYLPEYHTIRNEAEFFEICRTPELAAEITLQPLKRFPTLDAVIIFSDILVIPQAMGMEVQMVKGRGPVFPEPLVTPEDVEALNLAPGVGDLQYVFDAIVETKRRLAGQVPLIGFAGAPWTLFAYMVEGGGSKTFAKAKGWLYKYPEACHRVLSAVTDLLVEYLTAQAAAGANLMQVFDSWAGELSPALFAEFCTPYLKDVAKRVRAACPDVPLVLFAKGAHYALSELNSYGYQVVQLDWTIDPATARSVVGDSVSLQGNLDPCALYGDEQCIRKNVRTMLNGFGCTQLIANLGHGLHPTHNPDNVGAFITAVHDISRELLAPAAAAGGDDEAKQQQ